MGGGTMAGTDIRVLKEDEEVEDTEAEDISASV
jgi:hypothetical protein